MCFVHCSRFKIRLRLLTFCSNFQARELNNTGYSVHQLKGDATAGNRKAGYLNKRSEGRLRNVWQRRRCEAREGFLEIYHGDETKPPTRVNLLTCQMKPVMEEELCFDVVSYNRTYHFKVRPDFYYVNL